MTIIMVDIEADGPIPGDYSMIALGAVVVDEQLDKTFYGQLRPVSDSWIPEALAITGFSRADTLQFDDPTLVMQKFAEWLQVVCAPKSRPAFFSDNNGFDWQFVNWYFHHFLKHNPFGFSSANLSSLYKGLVGDMYQSFKHLKITKHTHHPVDDAMGNAQALLYMKKQMNLKISLSK